MARKVKIILCKVRERVYTKRMMPTPGSSLQICNASASIVKAYNIAHEKEMEKLSEEHRREAEQETAQKFANAPKHTQCAAHDRSFLLDLFAVYVSDGDRRILLVLQTHNPNRLLIRAALESAQAEGMCEYQTAKL